MDGAAPLGLEAIAGSPGGREWLDRLPALIEGCRDRWGLRIGDAYTYATSSLVLRVERDDGTPAALKLAWPHREAVHEPDALAFWDGDGAVRLLDRDPDRWAMLLERAEPGGPLSDLPEDDALDAYADLARRLWKPAGPPFMTVADEARWWASYLPKVWHDGGEPFERRLLDAALELASELPATQGDVVLVHQDLHADNIVRARRQPWLAIDPKPLLAEPEFGAVAIVRGDELGRGSDRLRHRLDRVSSDLDLDRDRVRLWAFLHTLAWAVDENTNETFPEQVELARWLLDL